MTLINDLLQKLELDMVSNVDAWSVLSTAQPAARLEELASIESKEDDSAPSTTTSQEYQPSLSPSQSLAQLSTSQLIRATYPKIDDAASTEQISNFQCLPSFYSQGSNPLAKPFVPTVLQLCNPFSTQSVSNNEFIQTSPMTTTSSATVVNFANPPFSSNTATLSKSALSSHPRSLNSICSSSATQPSPRRNPFSGSFVNQTQPVLQPTSCIAGNMPVSHPHVNDLYMRRSDVLKNSVQLFDGTSYKFWTWVEDISDCVGCGIYIISVSLFSFIL